MIRLRAMHERTGHDSWGQSYTYKPVVTHYVIAKSRRQAVRQAKTLAGFRGDACSSNIGVAHVEVLEEFDA